MKLWLTIKQTPILLGFKDRRSVEKHYAPLALLQPQHVRNEETSVSKRGRRKYRQLRMLEDFLLGNGTYHVCSGRKDFQIHSIRKSVLQGERLSQRSGGRRLPISISGGCPLKTSGR